MWLSDFWLLCLKGLAVLAFLTVLAGACLGVGYLSWQYDIKHPKPSPQALYEQAFDVCKARETLSDEQCHDIAMAQAFPNLTIDLGDE